MSQEDLASEIGVGAVHISDVERGAKGLGLDKLITVCKYFNISMDDLLSIKVVVHDDKKKLKMIADITKALESLDAPTVAVIRAMVCALAD